MRLIRLLKNEIAKEAAEWVEENILTISQAEKICRRYGVDYHQTRKRTFGYYVLIVLGFLFVGLSIITLLGANWDDLPRALRMWGLIVLTMATQGFAIRKYLSGNINGATGLFLLGNLFYGASIILIAQIYHLGEHMPDGVFWWALGCLPVGIIMNSPWVTLQATLLSLIWFFMEAYMGFYPALFPLFIIGAMAVLYKGRQSTVLFLTTVACIGFWVEYSLAEYWRDSRHFSFYPEHVGVSVALFIFAYAFSHWLNLKGSVTAKDYGAVLALWSLRFGLIFMMVMSYRMPWEHLIQANWNHKSSMFVIVAAILTGALVLAYKSKKPIPAIYIIPFYLLTFMAVFMAGNIHYAIYFQIVYNLVLIAAGVWLIIRGINSGISHYFYLGVASILIVAFMRYVDLIGDYIGGAVLFMVFAAVLFGAAKYWQRHKSGEGVA